MVRMNSSVSTPRHCANPGVVFPLHFGQIVSIIQRQYIQCTYITHHITTRPTTCANPGVVFPLHCSRSFLLCRLTWCSSQGSRKLVRMLNSFLRLLLIESVGNLNFLLGAPTKEVKSWLELSIVLFEHFWVIQWYHFGSSIC